MLRPFFMPLFTGVRGIWILRSSAQPRPATWSIRDGAWGVLS
jgi:hypothetical protein